MFTSDEYEEDPARDVHKRGMQKKVNRQSGHKMTGVRDTESMLESNILVAGHVDPRVRRIVTQPVTFDLNTGRQYSSRKDLVEEFKGESYDPWIYTPDFRFELHRGDTVFVEGKFATWPKDNPKFESVIEAMTDLGHRLMVVTNRMFPRDLEHNIRLLKLRMSQADYGSTEKAVFVISGTARASEVMRQHELGEHGLLDAILEGHLKTDLNHVLSPDSIVEPGHGSTKHLEILDL